MKKLSAVLFAVLILATSGCMNLYTRCPGTDGEISSCYQSSGDMLALSMAIAFPQILYPGNKGFYWENLFTVPCGLVCLADTACEAVLDTVCLPFDYPISCCRNGGGQNE